MIDDKLLQIAKFEAKWGSKVVADACVRTDFGAVGKLRSSRFQQHQNQLVRTRPGTVPSPVLISACFYFS